MNGTLEGLNGLRGMPMAEEREPIPGPAMGVHGSAPADIEEFIAHVTKDGPIDCLSLYHETFDGKEKVRDIGTKTLDPITLSEVVARLVQNRAQGRNQRASFILEAWAGASHRGTHTIVRDVQVTSKTMATEPPTEAGFSAQMMRHYEVMQRQSHQLVDANFGHLARTNRELQTENRMLRAREIENMVMLRDNLVAGADIENRRQRNQIQNQAIGMLIHTLIASLPSLIQKFTANEVVEQFRAFVTSLTPEEQLGIANSLSKEHTEQLAGLYKTLAPPQLPDAVEKIVVHAQQVTDPNRPPEPPQNGPPAVIEAAPSAASPAAGGAEVEPRARKKVVPPKTEE